MFESVFKIKNITGECSYPGTLQDLDLSVSTDFEDLVCFLGDTVEFLLQDVFILIDGLNMPILAHIVLPIFIFSAASPATNLTIK